MKESGGHAVKLEVEKKLKSPLKNIKRRNSSDGTFGFNPQSIYKFGTYTVRAKEEEEAHKLMKMLNY
jgi:3-methyl-2-oxobutanoate hydroxymethyltransferase